jgi:pimeloyl-ACP methyl ester carboxylesterase
VRPFTIDVSDATLDDLRQRLLRTRWPDDIQRGRGEYGPDVRFMDALVRYWISSFDWRTHERALNELPQGVAEIDGLSIHFVHLRGIGPAPMPIVLTHGWPGSFVELLDVARQLADPASHGADARDAFDVVVPSLPGFGFSSRPQAPGTNLPRIADVWAALMVELGYKKFVAQGGDFGAAVATWLAVRHPGRLLMLHLNYIPGSYAPQVGDNSPMSDAERAFQRDLAAWWDEEGAYAHVQRTRPQTLSYAIADSPAGLAAWIVDKFRLWSDCGGDVERRFSKDALLLNVMIYWVTNTFRSSIQLYDEARRAPLRFGPGERLTVPAAIARFPVESPFPPRDWIERGYPISRWTDMPRGGHFAAWEEPRLLADDVRASVRHLR